VGTRKIRGFKQRINPIAPKRGVVKAAISGTMIERIPTSAAKAKTAVIRNVPIRLGSDPWDLEGVNSDRWGS